MLHPDLLSVVALGERVVAADLPHTPRGDEGGGHDAALGRHEVVRAEEGRARIVAKIWTALV